MEPGTYRTVQRNGVASPAVVYWSARQAAESGSAHRFAGTPTEAVENLDLLLTDAVRARMVADVPLGAFLSGGIDSSTVVALMQKSSARPVKTFTIGFGEGVYNEAVFAAEVARHLGTDHTELYISDKEARDVIPNLPQMFDEPFADSSQIPTFLVSQLARSEMTVALSGDGGDELFGGYTRYLWAEKVWDRVGWMPRAVRGLCSGALELIPQGFWDRAAFLAAGKSSVKGSPKIRHLGDKMERLATMLNADDATGMYRGLVSYCMAAESIVIGAESRLTPLDKDGYAPGVSDFREIMMLSGFRHLPSGRYSCQAGQSIYGGESGIESAPAGPSRV